MPTKGTVVTGLVGVIGIAAAIVAPIKVDEEESAKRIAESKCIVSQCPVDSATGKKLPSSFKFNPLYYMPPEDTLEVTVRLKRSARGLADTNLFIGNFQSDTSALPDVSVNLQPSVPDKPAAIAPIGTPVTEPINE
jgi:hypothetical protein